MIDGFATLWGRFDDGPLLWLPLTLAAYMGALWLHGRAKGAPLVNPVLIAIVVVALILWTTATPYAVYFSGVQILHFLLGTATVALALPLWRQLATLRRFPGPLLLAITVGSAVAAGSAVGIAALLGASRETLLSLAPKSVTTPIAIGIAEQIGGLPALTAVLVIVTGIVGAVLGRWTLDRIGVRDWRARGLAVGTVSHGLGTARAFQVNDVAGAFSALAMGVNGLLTALLLPTIVELLR